MHREVVKAKVYQPQLRHVEKVLRKVQVANNLLLSTTESAEMILVVGVARLCDKMKSLFTGIIIMSRGDANSNLLLLPTARRSDLISSTSGCMLLQLGSFAHA